MKPKWHQNLILVCEKCGTKLEGKGTGNPARDLKDWLKKELQAKSLWGANRVVTSSCLDICPDGKIAIAYVSDRPHQAAFAEGVDPETERQRVLLAVIERATERRTEP